MSKFVSERGYNIPGYIMRVLLWLIVITGALHKEKLLFPLTDAAADVSTEEEVTLLATLSLRWAEIPGKKFTLTFSFQETQNTEVITSK